MQHLVDCRLASAVCLGVVRGDVDRVPYSYTCLPYSVHQRMLSGQHLYETRPCCRGAPCCGGGVVRTEDRTGPWVSSLLYRQLHLHCTWPLACLPAAKAVSCGVSGEGSGGCQLCATLHKCQVCSGARHAHACTSTCMYCSTCSLQLQGHLYKLHTCTYSCMTKQACRAGVWWYQEWTPVRA
jgi:hypothetical protein